MTPNAYCTCGLNLRHAPGHEKHEPFAAHNPLLPGLTAITWPDFILSFRSPESAKWFWNAPPHPRRPSCYSGKFSLRFIGGICSKPTQTDPIHSRGCSAVASPLGRRRLPDYVQEIGETST